MAAEYDRQMRENDPHAKLEWLFAHEPEDIDMTLDQWLSERFRLEALINQGT